MSVPRPLLRLAALFSAKVRSNLAADAGDAFRTAGNWDAAASNYRRAVRIRPDRRAIWVQLGHALNQTGQSFEALDAYRKASALPGDDGDAPLHHGVLAKRLGEFAEAKAALQQACREAPDNASARLELLDIVHHPLAVGECARQLASDALDAEAARLAGAVDTGGAKVVFDTSDLVSYFRHSRLPTGIQRVQMEVIRNALAGDQVMQIGCFSDFHGVWVRIPAQVFERLCALSIADSDIIDPDWVELIETVTAIMDSRQGVGFAQGAFLVNLGTSWWMNNYFLHVRHAQREHSIRFIPFIHDFIPVMFPEHCVRQLTQDFLSWTLDVFHHADFFLVNSGSTAADLHRVAGLLGKDVAPSQVAVVPLDADFRRPGIEASPADRLAQWHVAPQGFALFVSTIESRKNHRVLFLAWRELMDRHGPDNVPDLVCVGNRGWLNDHVHKMLADDPLLAGKVRMLSQLSDGDLALLYRSCRFSVYPSLYEGWGLPVTESLCYGKVPLVSTSASLPEVGGDFALYVDPEDLETMVSQLEVLCFDNVARLQLEARIAAGFQSRTWHDIARQIHDEIAQFVDITGNVPRRSVVPAITFDKLYRFRRNRQTRLAPGCEEGEALRDGLGWWQPEDWGCSVRPDRGELAFAVDEGRAEVRCFLRLRGPEGQASEASVHVGDRVFRADLPEGQWRWFSVVVPVRDRVVRLGIAGHDNVDLAVRTLGHDRRIIGPGLGGLIVVEDVETRTMAQMVRRSATRSLGAYAFLRDAYPMLLNRDLDDSGLQDYLLAIESGGMTLAQVVDSMIRLPEAVANESVAAIFD